MPLFKVISIRSTPVMVLNFASKVSNLNIHTVVDILKYLY